MQKNEASDFQDTPVFDQDAIRSHIELLHNAAKGIDGIFVVSTFNGVKPGTITHHKVGDVDGMVGAVNVHERTPGANPFTGLQLIQKSITRGSRGTELDIIAVLGLVADMDSDTGKIGEMPVEPSYVVETSPGNFQSVILFDKPMAPQNAKRLAKALQKATGADYGTGDIAHVWRIPGTLNYPSAAKIARGRSREPAPVTLAQGFEGLVYGKEELEAALASFLSQSDEETQVRFNSRVETSSLWDRLTDIGRAVLIADGHGDRSAHMARVVEQLGWEDFALDEIVSLCLDRPGDWTKKYGDDDDRFIRDIERCYAKFAAGKKAERQANKAAADAFLQNQEAESPKSSSLILPPTCSFDSDPFCLDRPGGLITDVAQFVYETSPSPIADFSIMSAVALHAGLFGRRWLTPEGLGLNLYIALVAGSGFGKDRPLKALSQLAESIGYGHIIGPNDVASDSALEAVLRQSPCQVLPLDELGMLLSASGKASDSYARARRKALLELYSNSTSSWVAKVRAMDFDKNNKPKTKIQWPTLSFLGAATPSTFYLGLEEDAFTSGFIARCIVIAVEKPPNRQSIDGYPHVPPTLIDRLSKAVEFSAATPSFAKVMAQDSATVPDFRVARWGDTSARFRLDQIRDWALETGMEDERRSNITNRAGNNTSKLATIRAISRSPHAPCVTTDDIEWAFGIVMRSIKTVEDGAERFMSGSKFETLLKAILEAVRQSKDPKGLKNAELLRKPGVSSAEERMFGDALSRLIDGTGQLKNIGAPKLGPRGRGGRYVLATLH